MKGLFTRKKKAKTVVCVDSDTAILDQLTKILEELSFFPMCFTSSSDAREFLGEQAASGGVAMVISSMMMPGLSGMQLLQETRASPDEVTRGIPYLLLSSFNKGNAKMQEFQIKTADGGTVDILIKPLVSGLVVKKIRELTDKDKPDVASPSSKKKDKAKGAKSPQSDRKLDKNDVSGLSSSSAGVPLNASSGSVGGLTGASLSMSSKDGTRKSKSTPYIADTASRSDSALPSVPLSGVSFALDAPRDVALPSNSTSGGGDRDSGRARSKTMSPGMSPVAMQRQSGALPSRDSSGNAPSQRDPSGNLPSRHQRKSSDPIISNSAETFLDTVFSGGSVPTGNKNSAGPNWDELETDEPAVALGLSGGSKLSRRKTIHGISKKKLV
jgi:FixJ family two-component response regulator